MDCPKTKKRDTEAALSLPDDPLLEILSRVRFKTLCRSKCVSKAWRDLIADPQHRKKLSTLEGFYFMVKKHYCHGESDCDEPCGCYYGEDEGSGVYDCEEEEVPNYGFVDVLEGSARLVDFSYLTELPGIYNTRLVHCCNGLLLFAVKCACDASWDYVVCNPTTKECVAVPSSGLLDNDVFYDFASTYLLFDPGAPGQFNLVEFQEEGLRKSMRVYSSETQAWSHKKLDLRCNAIKPGYPSIYVDGLLHLISYSKDGLTVLDVEGNIQKTIPRPCQEGRERWTKCDYIGRSQGRLHFINHETPKLSFRGFFIWVLEDYDGQQWVLKDMVSFSKLFGESNGDKNINFDCNVVGIHPDHNLVFFVQLWDQKMISYHMDSKEVRDLCTLEHEFECITPYVPCFSELSDLENEQ